MKNKANQAARRWCEETSFRMVFSGQIRLGRVEGLKQGAYAILDERRAPRGRLVPVNWFTTLAKFKPPALDVPEALAHEIASGCADVQALMEAGDSRRARDLALGLQERCQALRGALLDERRERQNPTTKALPARRELARRRREETRHKLLELAREAHADVVGDRIRNPSGRLPRVLDVWERVAAKTVTDRGGVKLGRGGAGLSTDRVSRIITKRYLEAQGLRFRRQ
jgi:hypothetical protein